MSDNTRYIFIVEVDKNLAIQCYERGLSDLNAIWPQVLSTCVEVDNSWEKAEKERLEKREKEAREEARVLLGKKVIHRRALPKAKWWHFPEYVEEVQIVGVTEAALDTHMLMYGPRSMAGFRIPSHSTRYYTEMLEALGRRLQHIKLSALPTLRMDEQEAEEMRKWGDGSRIAEIKKSLKLEAGGKDAKG